MHCLTCPLPPCCPQLLNRQADVSHALQLLEDLTFNKDTKAGMGAQPACDRAQFEAGIARQSSCFGGQASRRMGAQWPTCMQGFVPMCALHARVGTLRACADC